MTLTNLITNKMKTKTCAYCKKEFEAERISAKYCCDSCKTKANIQRRKEEQNLTLTGTLSSHSQFDNPEVVNEAETSLVHNSENVLDLSHNPEKQQIVEQQSEKKFIKERKFEMNNPIYRFKSLAVMSLFGVGVYAVSEFIKEIVVNNNVSEAKG